MIKIEKKYRVSHKKPVLLHFFGENFSKDTDSVKEHGLKPPKPYFILPSPNTVKPPFYDTSV
jgi:hypothetical protein